MCFAPQWHALFRHHNFQKWSGPGVFCAFWLRNVLRATMACNFSTSQLPKVLWSRQFFTLLTSKRASRHNSVHFFDVTTSKSGLDLVCFVHFDFEMCFAPQRRALFRHLNFQKCSDPVSFLHFWLRNVLRATTACNFSSHLASWLRTRRFSEPIFRPSGATNHWKNIVFRDFPTFSRTWIFFLLRLSLSFLFSSLTLPISAFHLSILSEVWLLNFLRLRKYVNYVNISPPFNPGIFGGVRQEISEKYFTWPHEIYPPHMFLGLPKDVGGVLRMQHFSPEMVWHTLSFWIYIHTFILSYIHIYIYIHIHVLKYT